MSVLYQVLGTFIVCWSRMAIGVIFNWPAFTVELFRSDATPLHRPMTDTESSLFGSITAMGAMVGTPILGLLLDVLGRKKCMILSASALVLAWTMMAFSRRVEIILIGMLIGGLCCGVILVIPVYINEICQPHIRGAMVSCMLFAFAIGMLWSYLMGGFLEYNLMCYVCLSIAVIGLLMTVVMKESPVFLMRKGREDEAAHAMAFYRNAKADSNTVIQELNVIRNALNNGIGEENVEKKEEFNCEETKQDVSWWKFLKTSKSTRKAAAVSLGLVVSCMLQGFMVVCVYAEPLFKQAVPSWSPILCSVILAGTNIVASLPPVYLIEVAGRRPLLIYSSLGCAACCVLLGTQIQYHWAPNILNVIIILIFCFVYSAGSGCVPYVLAAEVFLPEVSGIMSMVAYEVAWLGLFVLLLTYGPLVALVGLGGLFYVFAGICLFTVVYTMYCLPETKGLTVNAIQKLFLK